MENQYTLENEQIRICVNAHGAELVSLVDKETGREYMWSGDEKYWNRVSPVLFPLVGNYRDHKMTCEGRVFESGQHGFARDMDFMLASQMGSELWFVLSTSPETLEKYPYMFSLMVGYRITGRKVRVMWNVMNNDTRYIHFSIGGHPAFLSPVEDAVIEFDVEGSVTSGVLEGGLLSDRNKTFELDGGKMKLSYDMFDEDALIFEDQNIHRAALYDPDGSKVLELLFDSPLVGVWTPVGKRAPFVCIEPWYGRTDRLDFEGNLKDREWGNTLKSHEVFSAHYDIII